jgi:hypothetical protein
MRLGGNVVRVYLTRQLDILDQVVVRRGSRENKTGGRDFIAERVVDFVTVTVTL